MRFGLIVQNDSLYLPKHANTLLGEFDFKFVAIISPKLPSDTIFKFISRYHCVLGTPGFLFVAARSIFNRMVNRESIKKYAKKNKVEIVKVRKINDTNFVEYVKDQRVDYLISIGCPQILGKELLRAPSVGCINLHGGYLPDYPGVFSAFWNLMDDSLYAGATVHLMDESVDSGQIFLRERFPIGRGDTLLSLYSKIADLGVKLLSETLIGIQSKKSFHPIPNIHNRYFSFPTKIDRKKFKAKGHRVF